MSEPVHREQPLRALDVEAKRGQTVYPEPFAQRVAGRTKRKLGDVFGLTNFGVNLTHLEPGAESALLHYHMGQDEFVFILEGHPTVIVGSREYPLAPGDCVGFKAGNGLAHHLVNRTEHDVAYIEVGDRTAGDRFFYPEDDLAAVPSEDGTWRFTPKDA